MNRVPTGRILSVEVVKDTISPSNPQILFDINLEIEKNTRYTIVETFTSKDLGYFFENKNVRRFPISVPLREGEVSYFFALIDKEKHKIDDKSKSIIIKKSLGEKAGSAIWKIITR